jgi:hypothetical protein
MRRSGLLLAAALIAGLFATEAQACHKKKACATPCEAPVATCATPCAPTPVCVPEPAPCPEPVVVCEPAPCAPVKKKCGLFGGGLFGCHKKKAACTTVAAPAPCAVPVVYAAPQVVYAAPQYAAPQQ